MPRTPFTAALLLGLASLSWAQEQVAVRFEVNDALVKERNLPDVEVAVKTSADGEPIASGRTDATGSWATELPRGTCYVTYAHPGYVTIEDTEVEVREAGQVVTISLLPALESEGGEEGEAGEAVPLRVELILNWGSDPDTQVKDADSHLWVAGNQAHVYFAHKEDTAPNGSPLALDVDDMDWGGPETITLTDSPPGEYVYWVHDYSGGDEHLGASDVVVRLIEGNLLVAEYRCDPAVDARLWRPFKSLTIDDAHQLTIVDWTAEEIAAGAPVHLPDAVEGAIRADEGAGLSLSEAMACTGTFLAVVIALLVAGFLFGKAL